MKIFNSWSRTDRFRPPSGGLEPCRLATPKRCFAFGVWCFLAATVVLTARVRGAEGCPSLTPRLTVGPDAMTPCSPWNDASLFTGLVEGSASCGVTISWDITVPEGVSYWYDEQDPNHHVGFYMDPDAKSGNVEIKVTVTPSCSNLPDGCTTPPTAIRTANIRVIGATDDDSPCGGCGGGDGGGAGGGDGGGAGGSIVSWNLGSGYQAFGPEFVGNAAGPDMRVSLGADSFATNAGFLNIRSTTSTPDLGRPVSLALPFVTENLLVTYSGGAISQIKAPQGLVNVSVNSDSQYCLLLYQPPNITTNGSTYSTNGNPFVVYTVSYTSASSPLTITREDVGTSYTRQYQFAYDTQTAHWTATDSKSARSTTSWTAADGSAYDYQVIVGGQTIKSIHRAFSFVTAHGSTLKLLTQLVEGTGGTTRTTSYTYDTEGNPSLTVYPDGNWEYRSYDTSGRLTAAYTAWSSNSPPPAPDVAPDLSQNRYQLTEYAYELTSADDGIDHSPSINGSPYMYSSWRKKVVNLPAWNASTSAWEMHEVSRSYRVLLPENWEEKTCVTPGSTWVATSNLDKKTIFYPPGGLASSSRVQWERYVDGTYGAYTYSNVTLADGSAGFDQVLKVGEGSLNQDGSLAAIVNGTSTESIADNLGRARSVITKSVGGASDGTTLSSLTYAYTGSDPSGRSYTLTDLANRVWTYSYDCCGLESVVDPDGVTTGYTYDDQHRQVATTIYRGSTLGVTSTNILDELGQVLVRQQLGTNGASITLEQNVYDVLGRLTTQTNALLGVTTFSETVLSGGGIQRTTTYPDGGTRVEISQPDGRLWEVTGSATYPVLYEYGAETDGVGGPWREYAKETKLTAAYATTVEWTKRYQDGAGQGYKTLYAANGSTYPARSLTYNNLGQLTSDLDPDSVRLMYAYDAQGRRCRSGKDVDQNGVLEPNGGTSTDDRITDTLDDVLASGDSQNPRGCDIRRTRVWVFSTNNSVATTEVSRLEVSTDGLRTWRTVYRDTAPTAVTTFTQTTYGSNGARTNTVTSPDGTQTVSIYSYGRLMSVTSKDNTANHAQVTKTSFAYDPYDRRSTATDARNGTTTYSYNNADQLSTIATPTPGTGDAAQVTTTFYDKLGRTTGRQEPDASTVTNFYYATGLLQKTSGSRVYPVQYSYDAQGRMQTMTTWQNFAGSSGTAATTWNYDTYRGWLRSKYYPNASTGAAGTSGPEYYYTAAGRLQYAYWLRALSGQTNRVSRTYAYNASGDLYTVTYNDGTPSVTYTYDRRGRQATVVRNSITTSLSFNEADRVLTESYSGGTLAGLSVNNTYNGYLQRDSVNIKNGSTVLQSASFGYDTAGRLSTVTDGAYSAAYAYEANSALIRSVTFTNTAAGGLVSSRAYDYLNRLTSISSVGYGSAASLLPVSYAYRYNAANQRTQATLGDGSYWVYQYDALGQVISGKRYWSDGTPVAGQQFQYGFDDIGNRKTTAAGGDAGGQNLRSATYTANYLNQYSSRTVPAYLDVLGLANPTATVTVNGNGTYRKGEYFQYALNIPNSTPQYPSITVSAQWGTTNQSSTGKAYVPATPENLGYDTDGNLTSDGRWSYTWDGENRLTQMIRDTDTPSGARQKLTFEYDWQGRRIRKKFYTYNSGWVLQSDLAFLYDGWLLMGELNAASSNDKVRTYVWGTDLSGSIGGAGGVGGLLKVTYYGSTTTNAFVSYDGNGNIVALVDGASGSFAARYEFGPFAEPIRASGPMAMADPIRWSSKYQDDESELSYYGWRFYNPGTGRWLNRDPIEEKRGGPNLCAFVVNNPLTYIDTHGREVYAYCPSCRMPISPFEPKPHVCPPKPPRPPQYPDGFAVCTRWIDEPGFIVNCINHCGGAHTYVQYATTPKPPETGPMYLWGRGFTKGGVETERKFNPSTCTRCKKSDESKSDAEIMDCISNHPPSKPYSWGMLFNKYVCKEWAWEAATACGLSCK